jgi:hypothetical protein
MFDMIRLAPRFRKRLFYKRVGGIYKIGHGLPTSESGALQFPDGGRPTADRRPPLEKNRRPQSAVGGQICKDRLNHAQNRELTAVVQSAIIAA